MQVLQLHVPMPGSYRCEREAWKDTRGAMPEAPKGFLTPEESLAPVPLSFIAVRDAWRREYSRRFEEFVKLGGKPGTVTGPPMIV
jgi:hypothetical protein